MRQSRHRRRVDDVKQSIRSEAEAEAEAEAGEAISRSALTYCPFPTERFKIQAAVSESVTRSTPMIGFLSSNCYHMLCHTIFRSTSYGALNPGHTTLCAMHAPPMRRARNHISYPSHAEYSYNITCVEDNNTLQVVAFETHHQSVGLLLCELGQLLLDVGPCLLAFDKALDRCANAIFV